MPDPSAREVGNGVSLARLLAALIGAVDGTRLLAQALVDEALRPHASSQDAVLKKRTD